MIELQKIDILLKESDKISLERKSTLQQLATLLLQAYSEHGQISVTFVCTHNSRRSQLAQLWMRTACLHFGIDWIKSYSGGTEATAFNHRMVKAVRDYGFTLQSISKGENPKYYFPTSELVDDQDIYFSKKYDDPFNPQQNFIAVMVCDQADEACPFVPGAAARFPLIYLDPKAYDDTEKEGKAYADKVKEIGSEILYLVKCLKT